MGRLRGERPFWIYRLHTIVLNSIGAAILQSRVCERAVLSGLPQSLEEIRRLQDMLSRLEAETRLLVSTPTAGQGRQARGLGEIQRLCEVFQTAHPTVRLDINVKGVDERVPPGAYRVVTAVLAEALANAARHGEPTEVEVEFSYVKDAILFRVRDNGRGFDVQQVLARSPEVAGLHWGLRLMRDQATQAGGRLEISSAEGKGTQVTLYIPLATRAGVGLSMSIL